jgi:hypothetical protein
LLAAAPLKRRANLQDLKPNGGAGHLPVLDRSRPDRAPTAIGYLQ